MFCTGCGWQNPSSARFCGQCGRPQPGSQLQPAPTIANTRTLTARLIQLSAQAMKLSPRKIEDWTGFVRKELMDLVLYFASLDQHISPREAQVYSDISNTIDPGLIDDPIGFLDGLMSACIDTSPPVTLDRPLLLDLMEECDAVSKTGYASEVRQAFFEIALAVASADGPPRTAANTELVRYKVLLEPRPTAGEASAALDAAFSDAEKFPPLIEEVETEPTALELLAGQFLGFSEALPSAIAQEFSTNLPVDALILTSEFSRAAGRVTDGTAGFLLCIVNRVSRVRDALCIPGVMENFRKTITDDWKDGLAPKVPLTIATLLRSDEASGSSYFQGGWNLFHELIDALVAEDQPPSKATTDLRANYYSLLGYDG